jgi:hypothetical protein
MQPPAAPQQQHQQHKLQQRKQHQQQPSASGQQQLPQQQQQQQEHVLEVRMVPNQFIEEEFVLWQRYQVGRRLCAVCRSTVQYSRVKYVAVQSFTVQVLRTRSVTCTDGPSSLGQRYQVAGGLCAGGCQYGADTPCSFNMEEHGS